MYHIVLNVQHFKLKRYKRQENKNSNYSYRHNHLIFQIGREFLTYVTKYLFKTCTMLPNRRRIKGEVVVPKQNIMYMTRSYEKNISFP